MNEDWLLEAAPRRTQQLGYRLHLQMRPGEPEDESRQLLRRLEDYCRTRSLELSGYAWRLLVSSAGPITTDDQVALLVSTLAWPQVARVCIGPLQAAAQAELDGLEDDAAYLQVWAGDPVLASLALLHRHGRVNGEIVVQALGGFVRPARVD